MMKTISLTSVLMIISMLSLAQVPQGFFLDDWQPRTISSPDYDDIQQTTNPVTVAVTIDFTDTVTMISPYLFGDNANLWTGCMSDNPVLMQRMADRDMGLLRGPGGSTSDIFFWNSMLDTPLDSVPETLPGSTSTDWPWYGKRPVGWDSWTMDVDSFYRVLGQTGTTGIITVNYGYARYGTSKDPVAKAAHMAADWVRHDNGRSKFWEIGNEVYGSWEAGYKIDVTQNLDGQPQIITPTLYGQHCRVFIDSMKAAAAENGVGIKIGVVMLDAYSSAFPEWNKMVAAQAGDVADFYVVHSYFTPYNENSTVETILSSYSSTGSLNSFVDAGVTAAGMPLLPVALTEFNIFAVGSNQQVSHINGMHASLVAGEAIKRGFGAACRWDLANGWSNGDDHGMFSYNEPGIPNYTPHPAFFHLYFLRRFTGDVLLNSSQTGASGVVVIPSSFTSGQVGAALINTARVQKTVRLNVANFTFGDRYYTYTLTGDDDVDFSRKVYVNGETTLYDAGGPSDYATINARSAIIEDEIRVVLPPLSAVYLLVEPGTKVLPVNNEVTSTGHIKATDDVVIFPNPSPGTFTVKNIPDDIISIKVMDLLGRTVYVKNSGIERPDDVITLNLAPATYFVYLNNGTYGVVKKIVVQ